MTDHLAILADQIGFSVVDGTDVVRACDVPCLVKNGEVSTCTIEASFDPTTGRLDGRFGRSLHVVRVTTKEIIDGLTYDANGNPIGNCVDTDGRSFSDISITSSKDNHSETSTSPRALIHRYAKHIVGAFYAAGHVTPQSIQSENLFKIPNTYEVRSGIRAVQDRIRDMHVAIIGLGGTGSYILDLMSKTPVAAIHLLDSDVLDWHNLMRAPGAPTSEEIEAQRRDPSRKTDYHSSKYSSLREGIYCHNVGPGDTTQLVEFLATYSVDFAFVSIDQSPDHQSPRQDEVYAALSDANVSFIDSGISVVLDEELGGSITTSYYDQGSLDWKNTIPNATTQGDNPGYRNVQLPETNSMAAALAVMEWRRRTGQYRSDTSSFMHKLRFEGPHIRR